MKHFATLLAALVVGASPAASGGTQLRDYLPAGITYDPAVPTPESVLGFQVGDWHAGPEQIATYLRALAQSNTRLRLEETGRTHEQKPLLLLTITSPANLSRLDALRTAHVARTRAGAAADDAEAPVVVFLGYSVHGNEASGANAALLVAYHLAAAQGEAIEQLLSHAIVLLDPMLNPDGLQRFATWANMHRGMQLVGDSMNREHLEGWPSGRTNHYWFDLNRDWLPVQHPESQARLHVFHRWKPNVLADFHEMESNSTFFFQPGVPSRRHPLTPERNVELTQAIAKFHARALDAERRLYYSEERFDDYYYGKGSTYPDVNGAVGILFEQASARGHLQDTEHGSLSFPFAIRNQFITSLSTLQGAVAERSNLLRYQHEFFAGAGKLAAGDRVKGYVFGSARDRASATHMLHILQAHEIDVYALARGYEQEGLRFEPGSAYVVPLAQPQYRLARSMFERRTSFTDSLFYDISAWTLPLAAGVPCVELGRSPDALLGARIDSGAPVPPPERPPAPADLPYAYAFGWSEYYAPRALYRLQRDGIRAQVATQPFTALTADSAIAFERGTIVVPMGAQSAAFGRIAPLMRDIARLDGVDVHSLVTGATPTVGADLGSPAFPVLTQPKPLLIVGSGVDANSAGEIWHLLDRRFDLPLPLITTSDLDVGDLPRFTHVICVDGTYTAFDSSKVAAVERWIRAGGVFVATGRAAEWVAKKHWLKVEFSKEGETGAATAGQRFAYAEHEDRAGARIISGAIFAVQLDRTHPLGFGFPADRLAVFRDHRLFMQPSANPYATVARYAAEPLLSGYISKPNLARLDKTASVIADRLGQGAVVLLLDNPSFRGYWFGTDKLLLNALFFGSILERTEPD